MRLTASSCNPAQHTSSTMVQNYLSHSFYKTFSKPAAVPLVRSVAASVMFCCAQPWCVAIARVVHQIEQRSRTVNSVDFFRLCCAPQFFTGFSWNPLYSLVHVLPNSSAKSAPNVTIIYIYIQHFEVPIGLLSLQSRAHFADPIFQKCLERDIFFTFWSANQALATVPCADCWQLSQLEPRTRGNRDPTSATPGATLPEKTQGFGECSHPWIHPFQNCYTSSLLDDGWLTWWCGWHDWKCWPWQLSVMQKFSNWTSFDNWIMLDVHLCNLHLGGLVFCIKSIPDRYITTQYLPRLVPRRCEKQPIHQRSCPQSWLLSRNNWNRNTFLQNPFLEQNTHFYAFLITQSSRLPSALSCSRVTCHQTGWHQGEDLKSPLIFENHW